MISHVRSGFNVLLQEDFSYLAIVESLQVCKPYKPCDLVMLAAL
jgi:hypothetical protein